MATRPAANYARVLIYAGFRLSLLVLTVGDTAYNSLK